MHRINDDPWQRLFQGELEKDYKLKRFKKYKNKQGKVRLIAHLGVGPTDGTDNVSWVYYYSLPAGWAADCSVKTFKKWLKN